MAEGLHYYILDVGKCNWLFILSRQRDKTFKCMYACTNADTLWQYFACIQYKITVSHKSSIIYGLDTYTIVRHEHSRKSTERIICSNFCSIQLAYTKNMHIITWLDNMTTFGKIYQAHKLIIGDCTRTAKWLSPAAKCLLIETVYDHPM